MLVYQKVYYTYWNLYWYKIYASDWMIPAGLNFDSIQLNLVGGFNPSEEY